MVIGPADRPRTLRDHVSQRVGVLAHARIPRDDGHELWCFAKQFCRGKMHGIEGADRFDGKGAADTSEHGSVNVEDETAPLEGSQSSNGRPFFCWGQPTSGPRPDNRPARLCERKCRGHVLCFGGQRPQGRPVMLQQRGHQCSRLHVPNARRGSLWLAGTRDGLPRPRDVTLRHDRCRSVQRRCPAAAGCPASPRTGHQLPLEDGEYRPQ